MQLLVSFLAVFCLLINQYKQWCDVGVEDEFTPSHYSMFYCVRSPLPTVDFLFLYAACSTWANRVGSLRGPSWWSALPLHYTIPSVRDLLMRMLSDSHTYLLYYSSQRGHVCENSQYRAASVSVCDFMLIAERKHGYTLPLHDDGDVCVCVAGCVTTSWSHPVFFFFKRTLRLILVGDVFGLLAAFLGLNGVYLIHVIDIPTTHTHLTHTLRHTPVSSLRARSVQEADWWLQTDPRPSLQSFAL